MSTTPALSLSDVSLELGDGDSKVRPLDHVTLDVHPGEFVGVVGPSGAGTSTLLEVSGALQQPDSDVVSVHGQDLAPLWKSQGKLARFRLTCTFRVPRSSSMVGSPARASSDGGG